MRVFVHLGVPGVSVVTVLIHQEKRAPSQWCHQRCQAVPLYPSAYWAWPIRCGSLARIAGTLSAFTRTRATSCGTCGGWLLSWGAAVGRIYDRQRWRRLRRAKLTAQPTCEYCPAGTATIATSVDHKRAISDGGDPWDWTNLVSTCGPCHSRKTARGPERGAVQSDKPARGCDVDGRPLDPAHPWGGK
jgi:5-methylcytosine-specific restriction protein A